MELPLLGAVLIACLEIRVLTVCLVDLLDAALANSAAATSLPLAGREATRTGSAPGTGRAGLGPAVPPAARYPSNTPPARSAEPMLSKRRRDDIGYSPAGGLGCSAGGSVGSGATDDSGVVAGWSAGSGCSASGGGGSGGRPGSVGGVSGTSVGSGGTASGALPGSGGTASAGGGSGVGAGSAGGF